MSPLPLSIFKDYKSLIEDLKRKAKNYPLIAKTFLPLIEKYMEKNRNFSHVDDWLVVPHFQYLWASSLNDQVNEQYKKCLAEIENNLNLIYEALGDVEFEKLMSDILKLALSPTINIIQNKLLSFFCEFKAMQYFIDRGYKKIERIPEINSGKTADFEAFKDDESVIVECKFIHSSNPVRNYINRYSRFLSNFSELDLFNNGIRSWDMLSFQAYPQDLDLLSIQRLKKFTQEIIEQKSILHETDFTQKYEVKVKYERKEDLGPALVTIDDQLTYFRNKLKIFYNEYVLRLAMGARTQLKTSMENCKHYVYIFIELDREYNLPYQEMDKEKILLKNTFLENHGLDIEIIVEVFPDYRKQEIVTATSVKTLSELGFDNAEYQNKLNELGEKIEQLKIGLTVMQELIYQSSINFDIYEKNFAYLNERYESHYNSFIDLITKLHDEALDAVSIINMLKHNIKNDHDNAQSCKEKVRLNDLQQSSYNQIVALIPNTLKIGRAKNKDEINNELTAISKYLDLLTCSLETLSDRLIPIRYCSGRYSIMREVRELFINLKTTKSG